MVGRSARNAYTMADTAIAADRMANVRFDENLNSSDELAIASKPTNAHGIIANICRNCMKGEEPAKGENAGPAAAAPPSWRRNATAKKNATLAASTKAKNI